MASDVIAAPEVGARVQVGIDAAIVANHQVCVRRLEPDGRVRTERFHVPPTLAGLSTLSRRLAAFPDVTAVAEPTSMTWLPLALALLEAGGQLSLVGSRHAARLRGAIQGKNKFDVIDADVLARAGEVFELAPLRLPEPGQLALRRTCARRGALVIDAQPLPAPADLARALGVPGRLERVRRVARHRPRGGASAAISFTSPKLTRKPVPPRPLPRSPYVTAARRREAPLLIQDSKGRRSARRRRTRCDPPHRPVVGQQSVDGCWRHQHGARMPLRFLQRAALIKSAARSAIM